MNNINNYNPNFAGKGYNGFAKFITSMTKADNLAPIIALEATVTGGRTIQAYKRGGKEEARERIIEETTGAIVWLWGVKSLNALGDTILGKYFKTPGKIFDVGTDKVLRTPFENYMKNGIKKQISPNKVAALKGVKVLASILIANLFVGFLVPKINHYITTTVRHNEHEKARLAKLEEEKQQNTDSSENTSNLTFNGGGFGALNAFTNAIENTNTGKLLSTDFGVAGGRMINARTKEERNEIALRDLGSIYFYMWAQGHVANILNLIESGRATRLDPSSANIVNKYLHEFLEANGKELSVEEFKKLALGKDISEIKLPDGIVFEEGKLSAFSKFINNFKKNKIEPLKVAKVKDLENLINDETIMNRIREMSKLQPLRQGEAVITKQQIIDAFNIAEINNSKMLNELFENFSEKASTDPFKYISNKKLYSLKSKMVDYVKDICKAAKDGKVNKDLLDKVNKKNITYCGINFAVGFAVAAAFLSTIIPKLQYLMTQKKTGLNVFPGTYDYVHNREVDD